MKIKPVEAFPALLSQAKVQVVTIDVCNDTVHEGLLAFIKGQPAFAGGRRPGDAISRGVCIYYTPCVPFVNTKKHSTHKHAFGDIIELHSILKEVSPYTGARYE